MNSLVIDKPIIQKSSDIEYPTSDGKPMAETEVHIMAILHLISALRHFFRKQDVYVIGNMYLYYRQGNAKAHKAPDVMVVKNVGKHTRRSFKVWEEKAMPCVVFEITSQETKREDIVNKPLLYASLGIHEYFLFDPLHEYLEQQFLGYRLVDGKYGLIAANEDGEIFSTELQAVLRPEGKFLRIVEPQTGLSVPNLDEAVDMAIQETQRAEQEAQRAEQEAQRAEQETHRAEQETHRAEQEAHRAEQEAHRAEQEAHRAAIAEAEVIRLRAEMEELRKQLTPSRE